MILSTDSVRIGFLKQQSYFLLDEMTDKRDMMAVVSSFRLSVTEQGSPVTAVTPQRLD